MATTTNTENLRQHKSRFSLIIKHICLSVCKADGSGSEELNKCSPPSPAFLSFVNGRERKPTQKKIYIYWLSFSGTNLVKKVKNLSPNFKQIA